MKTKLDVGKEYWLSEQKISRGIYLGESNSGNFDFRITLGSKHTKPLGELDVMTSNLSVYSEYTPEKPWQFTTPIVMKCTEDQFNWIKDKLVEMGYKVEWFNWGGVRYLTTNYNSVMGNVDSTGVVYGRGRILFETFNPDLFLALAAMTDKEDGINGEWWKAKAGVGFHVQQGGEVCGLTRAFFRKATAQEIIEHFEKKEFVLPKLWHVVVTEENVDVLSKWRFGEEYPKHKLNIGYIVGFSSWQNSKQHNPSDSRGSFGSEITFDQFKKYVLKETTQSCQIIPIPPTKQATLFDDRVEITDWKPKEGDAVWVVSSTKSSFEYKKYIFDASIPFEVGEKVSPFIKRTESEAKQLVEKLKQAML